MFNKEIARLEGIDPAEVRREIHSMRVKGYPIIGDNDGLHRTHTLRYVYRQAEKMIAEARKMMEAAEGMIRMAQDPLTERQQRIYDRLNYVDLPEPEPLKHFDFIEEGDLK